jgi:iron complex outermembrane receptor protein
MDRTNRNLPGGLTKSEMESDPTQANPLGIAQDWNKEWTYMRMADKLSVRTEDVEFDAGVFWFHRDLENRGFFSPDFRQGIEEFYSDNFGGNLNFVVRHELFGRRNILTIGLSPQYENEPSQNYENIFGHTGATTARGTGRSINVPAYLEDQFYFAPWLSILAGAQAIFAERHFIDEFLNDATGDQSHRQNFWGFNPKLGAIYEINRQTQAFVNFSRSWQPPSLNNLVDFTEGPISSVVYTPLQPQHAWTLEVGTGGEYSRFQWELSLYRAWVRNELLEINDAFGNDIGTRNVPRTNHQGIEASLEIELLREILAPKQSNRAGDRLSFDQSYTLNDFHFDQNAVYGDNRLPGIPVHVYEAQLLYESPFGFYAGANVQCNFSRYPVDEADTLFADSYVLLGFRAGFRRTNGFSVFIDCRNLTNRRYAASYRCDRRRTHGTESRNFPSRRRALFLRWSFLDLVNLSGRASQEIQIVFVFVNSRIPAEPSSRPKPERFTPPNGRRGSDATIALMKTIPASSSDANSFFSSRSLVHALAPRPNVVSFASSTAAWTSPTWKTAATGPKTSSRYAGESFGTSTRTVGS